MTANRLRHVAALCLVALAHFSWSHTAWTAEPPSPRPNFLLLLLDDAGPEALGIYGIEDPAASPTPTIDAIARRGVTFQTTFAPAICMPSRVQLLTGRYANRTGAYFNNVWHNVERKDIYRENPPFTTALREAGYLTAMAGKWDAGPYPWTRTVKFDHYLFFVRTDNSSGDFGPPSLACRDYLSEHAPTGSRYWCPTMASDLAYDPATGTFEGSLGKPTLLQSAADDFGPDLEAAFLVQFVQRASREKRPFFALWSTVAPHGTHAEGLPTIPGKGATGDLGVREDGTPDPALLSDAWFERYRDLVGYVDAKLDNVVEQLSALGVLDNTVIIVAADNAMAFFGKSRAVERGALVPLVISGPGVEARRGLADALTDTSDLAPTILELAGVEGVQEGGFDGRSLAAYLRGATDTHRDWIYTVAGGSQVMRSDDFLLEAVNHLFGDPADPPYRQGRFYFTGDRRFGHNYELVTPESDPSRVWQRARFQKVMEDYPLAPLTRSEVSPANLRKLTDGPFMKKRRHLYNHPSAVRYDQSFVHIPWLDDWVGQLPDGAGPGDAGCPQAASQHAAMAEDPPRTTAPGAPMSLPAGACSEP